VAKVLGAEEWRRQLEGEDKPVTGRTPHEALAKHRDSGVGPLREESPRDSAVSMPMILCHSVFSGR
jgi:hypothetical protein